MSYFFISTLERIINILKRSVSKVGLVFLFLYMFRTINIDDMQLANALIEPAPITMASNYAALTPAQSQYLHVFNIHAYMYIPITDDHYVVAAYILTLAPI